MIALEITVLACAVLALAAAVLACVRAKKYRRQIGHLADRREKELRKEIDDLRIGLGKLCGRMDKWDEDLFGKVEDAVRCLIEERGEKLSEVSEEVTPAVLFASTYDISNNKFYSVSNLPGENSIFIITKDPDCPERGTFVLNPDKIAKVAECRDFLEGCCDDEGVGCDEVEIIDKGVVEFRDGEWRLKARLKLRFC